MSIYGSYNTLVIGERKPIIEGVQYKGLKTLFVRPRKNWPAASGQANPCVPADVEIEIRNKVGSTFIIDTVDLPAVGFAMELQGDYIEVFARYSTKQGLATPYNVYEIETGVIAGRLPKTPSKFYRRIDYDDAFGIKYPSGTDYLDIPSFSSAFRVSSNCLGRVYLLPPDTSLMSEYFDFQLCENWTYFGPEKSQFAFRCEAPGGAILVPATAYVSTSISVEFA